MTNIFRIGNLQITTPADWLDVTTEIEESTPPLSLAKPNGVGAIQFTMAEFRGGKPPGITLDTLSDLLADFAQSRKFGRGFASTRQDEPLLTVAASFDIAGRFWRVWYCSNGQSVALVTYNCGNNQQQAELSDCENIVRSLKFEEVSSDH
jgi:hypothetical protein